MIPALAAAVRNIRSVVADRKNYLFSTSIRMNLMTLFYCLFSSLLLWFSFPRFNLQYFAWFAFIPLFFAIEGQTKRRAFWLSYFSGFIFFILALYWLIHVTSTGLIILSFYLAFYFAFFGYFFVGFKKRFSRFNILLVIFLSSVWVILEYLRSQLLTGFPWVLLGYSQYLNIKIIQFIDITGSLGLSFLVIFVNLCIFKIIKLLLAKNFKLSLGVSLGLLLIFIVIYGYGVQSVKKYSSQSKTVLDVSLIQGNIPQEKKWASIYRHKIKEIYFDLSRRASEDRPDIIIWPETSYPDYIVDVDKESFSPMIKMVRQVERPILFGAVYQQRDEYFNSAFLIPVDLGDIEIYRKIHLVPFGEYLPLRKYISFLEQFVPINDFSEGSEFVIFRTKNKQNQSVDFGALICFEDTISELSRQFRLRGADFLVNITNDAWFKESSSPYQHLQVSVFRAVENRTYMLRAANTGITCIIDNCGRIKQRVKDKTGKDIFVKGSISGAVGKQDALSFYTRFGDIFILICSLYILLFAFYSFRKKKI